MPPILGSLSPPAIRRRLAPSSSSPSSIVPNAAMLATPTTPSRRSWYNFTKCKQRYNQLTWRVLPVLGAVFFYSQHRQNERIRKLKQSLADLNNKDKLEQRTCCCSAPPPPPPATTTSHPQP